METQEVGVILLADLVAGQDDDVLGIITINEGNVLIDSVGCALVPVRARSLLIRRQNMDAAMQTVQVPGLAIADVLVQDEGLILGKDTDGINVGVNAVGQREIDDTIFTAERYCRFGELLGQRVQTRALTACQDHCDHFFCHKISPLNILALRHC